MPPADRQGGLGMQGQRSVSAVLGGGAVLRAADVDVGRARERRRQRRLARLAVVLWVATLAVWWRVLTGGSLNPLRSVDLGPDAMLWLPAVLIVVLIGVVMLLPMAGQGRSPHLTWRPEQIDVGLDDVKGLGPLRDEVTKTLNLFLGYATFKDRLGGNPRRGILFEGKPGTGKTHMAKAMARHAGVPFLFVSATSFQSMWYGMTARKIRAFFKALRRAARTEGGAIGFIEEIDAIGGRRGGLDGGGDGPVSSGTGGVVNELLVQLQSFDTPPPGERLAGRLIDWLNGWLPASPQLAKRPPRYNYILVIAATNRSEALDPALLRPGRFDRRLYFDLPNATGRRELIDYFQAHHRELDADAKRAELAHITFGYTPVMIEHLLDESLIWALRAGRDGMRWADISQAKLSEEIGMKQPVAYTPLAKEMVATHEAGHAVAAYLSGVGRRLEVLDRQAQGRPWAAGPQRHRGALDPDPHRAAGLPAHRLRRHGRRGAVVRRVDHRAGRRPGRGHRHRRPDGGGAGHDRLAGVVPGHGGGPERAQRGRQGALRPRRPGPHRPAAQGGQGGRQGAARPAPAPGRGAPGRPAGARGADRERDPGGAPAGRGRPGRAGAGPRRPQPAREPAGAAGRGGRSGPGRVGSPRR